MLAFNMYLFFKGLFKSLKNTVFRMMSVAMKRFMITFLHEIILTYADTILAFQVKTPRVRQKRKKIILVLKTHEVGVSYQRLSMQTFNIQPKIYKNFSDRYKNPVIFL